MDAPLNSEKQSVATMPTGVGDAVGVSASWYVALVGHNTERAAAKRLAARGVDAYVAIQREWRVWRNGKKAQIERVVIPCMVFVRCSERERLQIVNESYIYRFMTDKAGTPTAYGRPVARIPDWQIAKLRFMLGNSDEPVGFTGAPLKRGDMVRVIRGSLRGLEGRLQTDADGNATLTVAIDFLGGASVRISPTDVEPLT